MVTTICYGEKKVWNSRKKAIEHFREGVTYCEGSERDRYVNILIGLENGLSVCTDDYDDEWN